LRIAAESEKTVIKAVFLLLHPPCRLRRQARASRAWITLAFILMRGVLEISWTAIASAVAIAISSKRTFLSPSNGFGFGLRYVGPQPFQFAHSLGQVLWAFERLATFHGDLSGNRSSSDEFIN
jgi:hypothetical protein